MIDREELSKAYTICCGKCDYEESDGSLVNHCPECCARVVTAVWRQIPELVEMIDRDTTRDALINSPETKNFLEGVRLEAAHQVERWGTANDRAKRHADWFWLVGYLVGKVLHAVAQGNTEKALHHCVSSAAALLHWHAAIAGTDNRMAPGSSDIAKVVEGKFPGEIHG